MPTMASSPFSVEARRESAASPSLARSCCPATRSCRTRSSSSLASPLTLVPPTRASLACVAKAPNVPVREGARVPLRLSPDARGEGPDSAASSGFWLALSFVAPRGRSPAAASARRRSLSSAARSRNRRSTSAADGSPRELSRGGAPADAGNGAEPAEAAALPAAAAASGGSRGDGSEPADGSALSRECASTTAARRGRTSMSSPLPSPATGAATPTKARCDLAVDAADGYVATDVGAREEGMTDATPLSRDAKALPCGRLSADLPPAVTPAPTSVSLESVECASLARRPSSEGDDAVLRPSVATAAPPPASPPRMRIVAAVTGESGSEKRRRAGLGDGDNAAAATPSTPPPAPAASIAGVEAGDLRSDDGVSDAAAAVAPAPAVAPPPATISGPTAVVPPSTATRAAAS